MWQRIEPGDAGIRRSEEAGAPDQRRSRRAYYRVSGLLPLRLRPLARDSVDAAVFDLSLPDPLIAPLPAESSENAALMARLRRIEEKLDLLLGAAAVDAPRPLSGSDRRRVTFSGSGLAVEVDFEFRRGDAFRIELLLPAPYSRVVRAVGEAAVGSSEAAAGAGPGATKVLALAFRHIEIPERDALVAYSYDLQRQALRAKHDGAAART